LLNNAQKSRKVLKERKLKTCIGVRTYDSQVELVTQNFLSAFLPVIFSNVFHYGTKALKGNLRNKSIIR
jgi:hypothetical protein